MWYDLYKVSASVAKANSAMQARARVRTAREATPSYARKEKNDSKAFMH